VDTGSREEIASIQQSKKPGTVASELAANGWPR
jgi:hypothetical protein